MGSGESVGEELHRNDSGKEREGERPDKFMGCSYLSQTTKRRDCLSICLSSIHQSPRAILDRRIYNTTHLTD